MSSFSNMEAEGACKASEEGGPALAPAGIFRVKMAIEACVLLLP